MKIIGARELNANNYKKISIISNINVYGEYIGGIQVNEHFTEGLIDKSDDEKIEEVIRYFIRYHRIFELQEDAEKVSIESFDGTKLTISRKHTLSKEIINELKEKFYIDRMEAYAESDVEMYWITSNLYSNIYKMSYSIGLLKDIVWMTRGLPNKLKGKTCMEIDVGRIFKYDEYGVCVEVPMSSRNNDFLDRMVSDMDSISFYTDVLNEPISIYRGIKNGKEVYFVVDKEVYMFRQKIDAKQRKDKEERAKVKQMKMEGF